MAGARTQGPAGSHHHGHVVDPRTSFAGHICLFSVEDKKAKSKKAAKAPAHGVALGLGIKIHEASALKADDWLNKMKAAGSEVPGYFKKQIKSGNNFIYVDNPASFSYPLDDPRPWLTDWLTAFRSAEWEMTTATLEISVDKGDANGPNIKGVYKPDLSSGNTIDDYSMYLINQKSRSVESFRVVYGANVPGADLVSHRKLILIANRVVMKLGNSIVKRFDVSDPEMLNCWFHEIACHAGRTSRNDPKISPNHGDADVEACVLNIDLMLPGDETALRILSELKTFLNTVKPAKP